MIASVLIYVGALLSILGLTALVLPRVPRPFVPSADGYASIAMNFRVVADGRGGSVLSTETRVYAPDAATRRELATYWRVIQAGSTLIRHSWLDAIRRRAEGDAR